MIAGFFLDYTSAARFASLHYETFAQFFAHQSRYDRAGEGQAVGVTDDENLSRTTQLRLNEFFLRDAPGHIGSSPVRRSRSLTAFRPCCCWRPTDHR